MSHSRMMAEHFGISILESDAKLLHERIQLLIAEAYNRGIQHEREACANLCDELQAPPHVSDDDMSMWDVTSMECADAIRARGKA